MEAGKVVLWPTLDRPEENWCMQLILRELSCRKAIPLSILTLRIPGCVILELNAHTINAVHVTPCKLESNASYG
eukprot:738242-Amphidinium_carterae.1